MGRTIVDCGKPDKNHRQIRTLPPSLAGGSGDWQQRLYCVQSCIGSEDATRLHRIVDNPSRTVAGLAVKLLAVQGSDDILVDLLTKLTRRRRTRLLRVCTPPSVRRHRSLSGSGLRRGDSANCRVASVDPPRRCSGISSKRKSAAARSSGSNWRRHPRLAAQAMLERLTTTQEPDSLSLRYARDVVLFAAGAEPDMIVRLAEALARFTPFAGLPLTHYLYRPNELAAISLDFADLQYFSWCTSRKLESSVRMRVLREQPAALPIQACWFRRLPASERVDFSTGRPIVA